MEYPISSVVASRQHEEKRAELQMYRPILLNHEYDEDLRPAKSAHTNMVIGVILAVVFYIIAIIMPLYNSVLFNGVPQWHVPAYNRPLTATWLQMFASSVVLFALDACNYFYNRRKQPSLMLYQPSWSCSPGFLWKCKTLILAAIAFAAVMALTNVGLSVISYNTHVLIRASEIAFVVAFAWPINGERPTILGGASLVVLLVGTIIVALDFTQANKSNDPVSLTINIASCVASGIFTVLLRRACVKLRERDPLISVVEISFFKMALATVVLLPFPLIFELDALPLLGRLPHGAIITVAFGVVITAAFQSVGVGLATYALATSVGILGQVKFIPQLALSYVLVSVGLSDIFKGGSSLFSPTPLHISGLVLTLLGACGYAAVRWKSYISDLRLRQGYLS
eukprot:TRINITY_DN10658_c0_g1_i1.p1 TRINITY_DN10658_c0_g1~~TRINITY_DN10658_c0_g1_i1.p1  ORF type:complete len:397 (+),score=119.60 TRINITY_DN10658_c0_g1_i1:90-1280(+)